MNIVNIDFAQYEEDENDCEINVGLIEGDQKDGFIAAKCSKCQSMNLFPTGMNTFKCSKCGTTNNIDKKE
jgi:LSD1 subclass zinc finger protein